MKEKFLKSILGIPIVILLAVLVLKLPLIDAIGFSTPQVIGQTNLAQTSFNAVNDTRGMHLGGVHTHKYANNDIVMYVYDSGNNRILGYLNPNNQNSDTPEKVFGQTSFNTGACNGDNTTDGVNPTNQTLCLNRGAFAISQEEEPRFATISSDADGNLYVVDQYNNRVLRFNNPFGTGSGEGDTVADYVWGQSDFTSKACNRGAGYPTFPSSNLPSNGICTSKNITASTDQFLGGGVEIDNWGNMWVADSVNNRVIRFPFNPATLRPADSADIVIGQSNLQSFNNGYLSCGSTPSGVGLCTAYVVKVDPLNGEVYIVHGDLSLNPQYRVTVYSPNTTSSNPSSYTFNRQFGLGELNIPRSLEFLDSNSLLIGDVKAGLNDRILYYNKNGTLISIIDDSKITGATSDSAVALYESNGEISIIDNFLYITEQRNHNSVLVFDTSSLISNGTLNFVGETLGGTNFVWNNITSKSLHSPFGLTYSKRFNQVFVSDGYRVLVWNSINGVITNQQADYVIGQSNFTSNTPSTGLFADKVAGLAVDENSGKLLVARNQEAYAFSLPIKQNNTQPYKTYLTRIPGNSTGGNIAVTGQPNNLIFQAQSVAFNKADNSLWIGDAVNSRVIRINDPYGTPTANLFIGQNNINGTQCNRNDADKSHPTAQTLCNPSSIAFDNYNNLYIAEGVYEGRVDMPGNKRIVEFDSATINSAIAAGPFSEPSANRVYAAPNFTTSPLYSKSGCLANTPCNPISISFDSRNRMTVLSDAYFNDQNKRIYIYTNPLRTGGYVSFSTIADTILTTSLGQGGFSFSDENDGLFIQDHTWNRVLYYRDSDAPSEPSIVFPVNGSINQGTTVTFRWSTAVDPNGKPLTYELYVGETKDNLVLKASNITTTSKTLTNLTADKVLYWRVKAKNNANSAQWSNYGVFNTGSTSLSICNSDYRKLNSASTITIDNFTSCPSANDLITVSIAYRATANSLNHKVSSITYGSDSFTFGCRQTGNEYATEIWYLYNPSGTLSDININFQYNSLPTNASDIIAGAVVIDNVDNTTPVANSACANHGGSFTNAPQVTIATQPNQVVFGAMNTYTGSNNNITFNGGSINEKWNDKTANVISSAVLVEDSSPNTTLSWTGNVAWPWSTAAIAVNLSNNNLGSAPSAPSNPIPADAETKILTNQVLNWTAGVDPENDPLTYDIYFGTDSANLPLITQGYTSTSYTPTLVYGATYYWKIVTRDIANNTASSPIWSFTTNKILSTPTAVAPNSLWGQLTNVDLVWTASVDADNEPITYDVYLWPEGGTATLVSADQSATSYSATNLINGRRYYWQIKAKSGPHIVTTAAWYFNTYGTVNVTSNLATGKTVTGTNVVGDLTKLTDGIKFTELAPYNVDPKVVFNSSGMVKVDLGNEKTIQKVRVQLAGPLNLSDYQLATSADGNSWTSYTTNPSVLNNGTFWTLEFVQSRTKVRYVRVIKRTSANLAISEMEVY